MDWYKDVEVAIFADDTNAPFDAMDVDTEPLFLNRNASQAKILDMPDQTRPKTGSVDLGGILKSRLQEHPPFGSLFQLLLIFTTC